MTKARWLALAGGLVLIATGFALGDNKLGQFVALAGGILALLAIPSRIWTRIRLETKLLWVKIDQGAGIYYAMLGAGVFLLGLAAAEIELPQPIALTCGILGIIMMLGGMALELSQRLRGAKR